MQAPDFYTFPEAPFPTLRPIGNLPPAPHLLERVSAPQFALDQFTNGEPMPPELAKLLAKHGYEHSQEEPEGRGMLFASHHGVTLHIDDFPSVLWVLMDGGSGDGHEFVVGNDSIFLKAGDVCLFDARRRHGLIACSDALWAVFSTYVQPRNAPKKEVP